MIHRPRVGKLHDTWMLRHPETGRYHLFYLYYPRDVEGYPPGGYRSINHLISDDIVNWTFVENIVPPQSDGRRIGTGMVFRWQDAFYMTYTFHSDHTIYLLTAADSEMLTGWKMARNEPILTARGRWYRTLDTGDPLTTMHFRDAFVVERKDGCYAFVAARSADGAPGACGCVFRAVSVDLVHWDPLPPLGADFGLFQMEVPDYFELEGVHYLLFSDASALSPIHTPSRLEVSGTFYAVGEAFEGPYSLLPEKLLLGSGCGRRDNYVGRHIDADGEHLLYFHHMGRRGAFGLPKRIVKNGDHSLNLAPWEHGIERLRTERLFLADPLEDRQPGGSAVGVWERAGQEATVTVRCPDAGLHAGKVAGNRLIPRNGMSGQNGDSRP